MIRQIVLCVFTFASFVLAGNSITIQGWVFDAETRKPVHMANVFLANTTRGEATDSSGHFSIRNIPEGRYELIIHHIGYELSRKDVSIHEENSTVFQIFLTPRVLTTEPLRVQAEVPKNWHKHLDLFTREFIGETPNARMTFIENPEVLEFCEEGDVFRASSDSLINVVNSALGYRMRIALDHFEMDGKKIACSFYPFFTEMESKDPKELEAWRRQRLKTYRGSFRHFLSAIAANQLKEEAFETFPAVISRNTLYIKKPVVPIYDNADYIKPCNLANLYYFDFSDYLVVYHHDVQKDAGEDDVAFLPYCDHLKRSVICLKFGTALIDSMGKVLTRDAFKISGYWGTHRVADLLAMDYNPVP